jgi:large subunit ribosomal protein L29
MSAQELRDLSIEQVADRLEEAREEYFKLRFQFATGQLTDTSKLKVARREVARIATVQREKELLGEQE